MTPSVSDATNVRFDHRGNGEQILISFNPAASILLLTRLLFSLYLNIRDYQQKPSTAIRTPCPSQCAVIPADILK
jgi:hypothetical protein